jgi:hypothetical protein
MALGKNTLKNYKKPMIPLSTQKKYGLVFTGKQLGHR